MVVDGAQAASRAGNSPSPLKVALKPMLSASDIEKSDAHEIKLCASLCYILCDFEVSSGEVHEFLLSDRRSFIYALSRAFRETQ
jgi:hypothetical protein